MEEIGSARRNIFDEKRKKRVLMCILNPVSNRTHRFPKYVTSVVTLFGHWLTVIMIKTAAQQHRTSELSPKSRPVWSAVTALTKALVGVDEGLSALPEDVQNKIRRILKDTPEAEQALSRARTPGLLREYFEGGKSGSTRLLALRWTAASALPNVEDAKRARRSGSFYKPTNNKGIELQKTTTKISEGNGEVDLKLVLA
ncbi:hypothetical protein EDB92DRAFT_1944384 [Lactarius akahatsu]|uniref:Uncharacterized protein n=1 Tax=Lactarius akahatsu TaxID=416441 RepID=A0AAD4QEK0_9AGAM|nr:hypothetical protein EDB92DRAFT_1944384 [Lactarius akahatsu]